MRRGTFGHPQIHINGRRLIVRCNACDDTDSIAAGLTPEMNRKKFETKGWSFTQEKATCPKHKKEYKMATEDRKFQKIAPQDVTKPTPTIPSPTKTLVANLLEAASLLDGARFSLTDYSNQELMEELQRRMK